MVPLIKISGQPDAEHPDSTEAPLPQGAAKVAMVHEMFDRIAPRYDLMNRLISLGLDHSWRRRAIGSLDLAPGSVVLDVATGTADIARELRSSGYLTVGIDLSHAMLASARGEHGPLVQADAAATCFSAGAFDGVICGFALRNFADLESVFAELARLVRPAGRLCFLEVDEPSSALLRAGHHLWFHGVVPRLGAMLSDGDAYRYLPRSVAYLPDRQRLVGLLEQAGFADVERIGLHGGLVQLITATRRGDYGIRIDTAGNDEPDA